MTGLIFNPEKVDETPEYVLGALGLQQNGDEYVYVEAKQNLTKNRGVRVGRDRAARVGSASAGQGGQKFCVAVVDIPRGEFGWVKWTGEVTCLANATSTKGQPLNAAAGGEIDAASTAGGGLVGCYVGAVDIAANAEGTIELYRAVYNNGST